MINYDYYGAADTWDSRYTAGVYNGVKYNVVKIPHFIDYPAMPGYTGCLGLKWYDDPPRNVNIDPSFAYIKMDKKCPMTHVYTSSALHKSGNYDTANRWDLTRQHDTYFGWRVFNTFQTNFSNDLIAFVYNTTVNWFSNPQSSFIPATVPNTLTINGSPANSYHAAYDCPVLSFDYRHMRLIPVMQVAKFAAGKTAADFDTTTNYNDFAAVITDIRQYDLHTYLTGTMTVGGITYNIYDIYPVVLSIRVSMVYMHFDGGVQDWYNDINAATPAASTDSSCILPTWIFDQRVDPDHVYYGDNNNTDRAGDYSFTPGICPCITVSPATIYKSSSQTVVNYATFLLQGSTTNNASNYYVWVSHLYDSQSPFTLLQWLTADIRSAMYYVVTNADDANTIADYSRMCVAYFGMYFTDGFDTSPIPETLDSDDVYCGVIDAAGITHGQYTHGADNHDLPQYTWTDPVYDTPLSPGGGDDGTETPSDPLAYNSDADSGFGIAFNYYVIDRGDLNDLQNWMSYYLNYNMAHQAAQLAGSEAAFLASYPDAQAWQAEIYASMGTGASPYQDIVGVMCYPFDLTTHITTTAAGYRVGTHRTNVYYYDYDQLVTAGILSADDLIFTGDAVTSTGYAVIDLGSTTVDPKFYDYRDYAPYCRLELQIPYHGTVDIDPADWIVTSGATPYTLSVQAIVDLATGSSLAIVLRDGCPMITMSGQMGISVPITADALTGTASSLMLASVSTQNSRIGSVAGFLTGAVGIAEGAAQIVTAGTDPTKLIAGIAGTTKSAINTASTALQGLASYQGTKWAAEHMAGGKMVTGGNTPSTSFYYETKCRLVRHYPVNIQTQTQYIDTVGGACNLTRQIGSFSGMTVFDSAILTGITATDDETAMIMQALQAGVIL